MYSKLIHTFIHCTINYEYFGPYEALSVGMSIAVIEKTGDLSLRRDPLRDVQVVDEAQDLVQDRPQHLHIVADGSDPKDQLPVLVQRLHLVDGDVELGTNAVPNLVPDAPLLLEGTALRQPEDHPQGGGLHTLTQVRATWTTR